MKLQYTCIYSILVWFQSWTKSFKQSHWLSDSLYDTIFTASDQKAFQELVFIVNALVTLITSRSDRLTKFFFLFTLTLLILRRWWQQWIKSTMMHQRYQVNLFFVVFCLFVLMLNLTSKLVQNQCICKIIFVKTTVAYMYSMQTNNCVCFL